jgi:hypothetical protein
MHKFLLLFVIFLMAYIGLEAQAGGRGSFRFLHLPMSARTTALGGLHVSSAHNDASIAAMNPALLDADMHSRLSFNHQFYFAGVQHGYFSYAHHHARTNMTFHTGFQFVSYGELRQFDEFEQDFGTFKAGEYAWYIGASKTIYERLRVGLNVKMINSAIENYSSFGIGTDLAALYHVEEDRLQIGFVISNLGAVLSRYNKDIRQHMPYDVRLGLTKRLPKAPFSVSVTAHHLHRWNLLYENPELDNNNLFEPRETKKRFDWLENTFRHLNFATEIFIGKKENFIIRVGYNHMRRRDMTVQGFRSIAGVSGGFGLRIKKFTIDYGFGTYHLAGSAHHFSISTNLSSFTKPNLIE